MSSIFTGLSTALSGIFANRTALDTVSHNISNVDNPNYVRQQAIHASSTYTKLPNANLSIGTGVDVQEIRQIRDEFLDAKYRTSISEYGYWSAKNSVFEEVQRIFNEISENGLQSVMDEFWNGWEELSKNPDNLTLRGLLKERAEAVVETVNHIGQQLLNTKKNLNVSIENKVEEINNIGKEIAKLNEKIQVVESNGMKANDYRDTRNSLLDTLSNLVSIEYYEDDKYCVNVAIGGKYLVNGSNCSEIEAKEDGSPYVDLFWKDESTEVNIKGGEMTGLIKSRDNTIVDITDKFNNFIKTVAEKVNTIHKTGYTLEGPLGDDFFAAPNPLESIGVGNIKVNDNLSTLNKIAASSEPVLDMNERGNGKIAEKIAGIRESYLFGDMTPDEYYREIISDLGVQANEAATMEESQKILISQVDERRKSISGVSLDEELADMLKYQHSYVANTRVVNAIDEMIDIIINKTGRVGR
ncbi:flagellar hook-associated protein FlgK [Caldisalinibacter kiritimatiensis]|uniref:Flagellar hook-associated protein 1 n=1 Tax=Caldisalinibacter kiritimatiensis TaxID=1304284 RepID=R1CAQ1_9FIRM|nr:flagellar hook-associated protein FlgK [Caldisalinibacter kiritimatiensis]EOC99394.1 Flagellar hook-associated protein FlgK [Caldisalinibacter kiritimatiensis]